MNGNFYILLVIPFAMACNRQIDAAAESRKLLDTDRAFAKTSEEQGAASAFNAFLADNAMLFPMGAAPISGKAAIYEVMSANPGGKLRWQPQKAEVAKAGDMGWSWGKYRSERTSEDGQPIVRYGKYVNVWKKHSDGEWRVIVDIGNPGPSPETAPKNK